MNDMVFSDASIASVPAVTQVFGARQRIIATLVELAMPVKPGLPTSICTVDDRTVTNAKVVASAIPATLGAAGCFVVLTLQPAGSTSVVSALQTEAAPRTAVLMVSPLEAADGSQPQPGAKGALNARLRWLTVGDFPTVRR